MNAPTQTQYPFKAVLRTIVAFLLGLLTTYLLKAVPEIGEAFHTFGPAMVDYITNGVVVILGGVWTWVMARPRVNAFLTAIGLGARPKSAEAA